MAAALVSDAQRGGSGLAGGLILGAVLAALCALVASCADRADRVMGTEDQSQGAGAGEASADGADSDTSALDVDTAIAETMAEVGGADAAGGGDQASAASAAAAATPAAGTAEAPEAVRLRRGMAHLAEREAALAASERERQTQAAKLKAYEDAQAAAQADPLAFFERLTGINEDGLLDLVVKNRAKPTPTAEDRVTALERQIAERDQRAAAEAQQARVAAWRDSVVQTVTAGGEKYDLVNSLGQHELVVETIRAYAAQYGTVIDADVAAAQVEKYLEGGLGKSKKFAPRAAAPAVKPAPAAGAKRPTTLAAVPAGEVPATEDDLPENPRDRFKAVMASLNLQ